MPDAGRRQAPVPGASPGGPAQPAGRTGGTLTPEQFAEHFESSARVLWTLAAGVLGDRSQVEDVLQDAAVIGLQKLDQFREGTNFVAWMGRMVRFVALNRMRFERRRQKSVEPGHPIDDEMAPKPTARAWEDPVQLGEAFDDELAAALRGLKPMARACLLLKTVLDLGYGGDRGHPRHPGRNGHEPRTPGRGAPCAPSSARRNPLPPRRDDRERLHPRPVRRRPAAAGRAHGLRGAPRGRSGPGVGAGPAVRALLAPARGLRGARRRSDRAVGPRTRAVRPTGPGGARRLVDRRGVGRRGHAAGAARPVGGGRRRRASGFAARHRRGGGPGAGPSCSRRWRSSRTPP